MRTTPALLVIAPAWVGDVVMANSLLQLLKARQPSPAIDVVAPPFIKDLLGRMPEVRRVYTLPVSHGEFGLFARIQLAAALKNETYEEAIVLPNSWKSALIPWFLGVTKRTGWRGEWRYGLLNDTRVLDKVLFPKMVQRFAALSVPASETLPGVLPAPTLAVITKDQQAAVQRLHLEVNKKILVLCPGAEYGPAKRWPAEYFAEVAQDYLQKNWAVWILGSSKEKSLGETIASLAPGVVNLTGCTTLAEVVDLLACADCVLSNDSGLMHIAAALSRPMVVVYGSSDPRFTPPISTRAALAKLDLPCSPCFGRVCRYGHFRCLRDITPLDVLAKLEQVTCHEDTIHTV